MDTPDGPPTTLHSPFSSLVSLSVSLVLCDTAAGGAEAAALARLRHAALPLWAVSSRLRSCAAAVEAGTNPAKAQLPGTPGDGATGWFDEEQTKEMHKEDEKRNKNKNKILQDQEWLCEIT